MGLVRRRAMSYRIYVVQGSTGEYSDRNEWPVRAFKSEAKAKAMVVSLEEAARPFNDPGFDRFERAAEWKAAMAEAGDPGASLDYTGVHYSYYWVVLEC